jgi:hypothetical protein
MRAVLQATLVASLMGTLWGADDNPAHSQVALNPREVVKAFLWLRRWNFLVAEAVS